MLKRNIRFFKPHFSVDSITGSRTLLKSRTSPIKRNKVCLFISGFALLACGLLFFSQLRVLYRRTQVSMHAVSPILVPGWLETRWFTEEKLYVVLVAARPHGTACPVTWCWWQPPCSHHKASILGFPLPFQPTMLLALHHTQEEVCSPVKWNRGAFGNFHF